MSASVSSDLRCPRCSAHVPAGAQWCSLCYADLREGERRDSPDAAPDPTSPIEPARRTGASGGGRHARRAPAPEDAEQLADAMLAELAAAESGNPLGRMSGLVDTPAKKIGLMVGGTVAAMLLLFLVMAVLGALV